MQSRFCCACACSPHPSPPPPSAMRTFFHQGGKRHHRLRQRWSLHQRREVIWGFTPDEQNWTRRFADLLPGWSGSNLDNVAYRFGHQIYTPEEIETRALIEDDRPTPACCSPACRCFPIPSTTAGVRRRPAPGCRHCRPGRRRQAFAARRAQGDRQRRAQRLG